MKQRDLVDASQIFWFGLNDNKYATMRKLVPTQSENSIATKYCNTNKTTKEIRWKNKRKKQIACSLDPYR